MTRSEDSQNPTVTNPWLWRALAAFWLLMLIHEVIALLRGRPGSHPHPQVGGLFLGLGGLCLALGALTRKRALRWALLGASLAANVASLGVHPGWLWLGR